MAPAADRDPAERFRDGGTVQRLADEIAALDPGRPVRVMHVCGTHENALCQFGLRDLLPPWLRLIAGPGCPVCVCPASDIDLAVRLSLDHGVTVATFGDVVRVPARMTLHEARARGGDTRIVYSIADALRIAAAEPARQVAFFAVGFETTACTTAAVLRRGVPANFTILSSHRVVPDALDALVAGGDSGLHGFLLPGHVCTVTGLPPFRALAERRKIPMVIGGFEPVDILVALRDLVRMVVEGRAEATNAYPRVVRDAGNPAAQAAMEAAFEVVDSVWRGIGTIPRSGLRIRDAFAGADAERRFGLVRDASIPEVEPGCRCGEVLLGHIEPEDCPLFGTACTPIDPIGPCMVSYEGTCQARFSHRRI